MVTVLLCAVYVLCPVTGLNGSEPDTVITKAGMVEPSDSIAVIRLEKGGTIRMEFLSDRAPLAVGRIKKLIASGFYDGLEFHRVEPYLVQTGKKEHDYSPVSGEMFSQYMRHEKGMVGMARLPGDYDSATTQFYICKKEIPSINGEYTLFARVIEGMEAVEEIEEGDRIEECFLTEKK
jgi:peptidyl-prolyl cis-trans isomerase B (cyclophilin B)